MNRSHWSAGKRKLYWARCLKWRFLLFSRYHVQLLVTPWNATRQASLASHYLPEFAQTHVHWVTDTIQPSHPLSPSSPALNLPQDHETTDWFQIGKGVRQGCILSPCLFNLYAEYIIVTKSCPTFWDPMDCSPPGSSVHGIIQVRTPE